MTLLVLLVVAVLVWLSIRSLKNRIAAIERVLADQPDLARRVSRLETGTPAPAGTPGTVPRVPAPASALASAGAPARPMVAPAVPPPAVTEIPTTAPPPALPPVPAAEPADRSDETWEVVVGTSWLNKIGVLVFVIGVALLLGYSMANVGPAGRVVIGFAMSAALLLTGIALERRQMFRAYAYGLVAGGWAGVYFTTFAMRAVDAARVIDSDLLGTLLLALVAVGMIAHSLRYRSQTVTALAYVVAYATLALTPVSWFGLFAALPLALSVLVVAHRLQWTPLSVLGIAASYLLFGIRSVGFQDAALAPAVVSSFLLLAAFWVTFEGADILAALARSKRPASAATFGINAAGFTYTTLLIVPVSDPKLWAYLAAASVAYLASAIVRRRLVREGARAEDATAPPFGTFHGALAMAAGLMALSLGLRLRDERLTLAWLLEAELVVVAGIALADIHLRRIGAALAAIVTIQSWLGLSSVPLAVVAIAWYVNGEWIRSTPTGARDVEHAYAWAATALAATLIVKELSPLSEGIGLLVLSAALIEAGLHRRPGYRLQGYLIGLFGTLSVLNVVAIQGRNAWGPRFPWPLAAAVVLAYGIALRAAQKAGRSGELLFVAGASASVGTLFLAMLEWRLLPVDAVSPAWALTAALLVLAGAWRHSAALRWQGYLLLAIAGMHALGPVIEAEAATSAQMAGLLIPVALMYAMALASKRAAQPALEAGRPQAGMETAARHAVSVLASLILAVFIADELRPAAVTPGWAMQGLGLLALGFAVRDRAHRLSGLALLLVCILKLFLYDLRELGQLERIVSFVMLGVLLLGVSWTYTRFREQIKKFL